MAIMIPELPEPPGTVGEFIKLVELYGHENVSGTDSEAYVWKQLKKYLPNDYVCYYQASVKHRMDFCLLHKEYGFIVIECKGWKKKKGEGNEENDVIKEVVIEHEKPIRLANYRSSSPLKQVERYRDELKQLLKEKFKVTDICDIPVCAMVCYPNLSNIKEYQSIKGLKEVSSRDLTNSSDVIFREELKDNTLNTLQNKIENYVRNCSEYEKWKEKDTNIKDSCYDSCRQLFEPNYTPNKNSNDYKYIEPEKYKYIELEDTGREEVKEKLSNKSPKDIIKIIENINGEKAICLLRENFGFAIIEAKNWIADDIKNVENEHLVVLNNGWEDLSPLFQAEYHRDRFRNKLQSKNVNCAYVFSMVCYPNLSEEEYDRKRLDVISAPYQTIFKEDLETPENLNNKFEGLKKQTEDYFKYGYDRCYGMNYVQCRKVVDPGYEYIPKNKVEGYYSRLSVFANENEFTKEEAKNIVREWSDFGTKEIVFVKNEDHVKWLKESLEQEFKRKGIKPVGKEYENLSYGDFEGFAKSDTKVNSSFSVFRFQVYLVKDDLFTESFTVCNGNSEDLTTSRIEQLEKIGVVFNLNQYRVEHAPIDKHICVRAGAGTGKTYSMISRIAFLCHPESGSGVTRPVDEIALITFTNAATAQMKQKLKKMFTNMFILTGNIKYLSFIEDVENMRISTIHNFAHHIMQQTSTALGVGTNFSTTISNYERDILLKKYVNETLQDKQGGEAFRKLPEALRFYQWMNCFKKFISECIKKSVTINDDTLQAFGINDKNKNMYEFLVLSLLGRVKGKFEDYLKKNNSIHLDQYMDKMKKCISSKYFNPYFCSYRYLFVDEFQDTDNIQIDCFRKLGKIINTQHNNKQNMKCNFFVVGDLKQSIYRFRGATTKAFIRMGIYGDNYSVNNETWEEYSLNINYRTDKVLLSDKFHPIFKNLGASGLLVYEEKDKLENGKKLESEFKIIKDAYEPYGNYRYAWKEKTKSKNTKAKTESKNTEANSLVKTLCNTLEEEINTLEEEIKNPKKLKNLNRDDRTIAILVRSNYQLDKIIEPIKEYLNNLERDDVVLDIERDDEFYKNDAMKDVLLLLGALAHPHDDTYLFALLMQSRFKQRIDVQLSDLVAEDTKITHENIVDKLNESFNKKIEYADNQGISWKDLLKRASQGEVIDVICTIYEKTKPWLFFKSENASKKYRSDFENIMEEMIYNVGASHVTPDSLYNSLLIKIRSKNNSNNTQSKPSADLNKIHVVCTTVHKAKGLEYDTVILPCTNDLFVKEVKDNNKTVIVSPYDDENGEYKIGYAIGKFENEYFDRKQENDESRKEEARILYVAMTRAIRRLVVLTPTKEPEKEQKPEETWAYYLLQKGNQ